MAEKKKLSVAEMLAAARGGKPPAEGAKAEEKPAEAPAAAEPAAAEPVAAAAPAEAPAEKPKPAATAKPAGGKMSVAEMMAAARAKGPAKPAEAPKAEAPKPAPKPAAEKAKPAPKEKEAAVATAEKTTDSILAGGAAKDKPGPITKAEAAAKPQDPTKTKVKPVAPPMPAKPAYATAKPGKPVEVERRGFMVATGMVVSAMLGSALGIGFTAISATFGLWGLALARFMFPNVLREPPSRFKVGFISDFPFGKVEEKYKAQYGVWVVNFDYNGQREIYALSTVCTHLGCTPNWLESEQKFKCPCHGSGFYKDGINFEGPAPRPLERYAIKIADDGQLEIDKSRKFQEEMGQWDDPNSFVNV